MWEHILDARDASGPDIQFWNTLENLDFIIQSNLVCIKFKTFEIANTAILFIEESLLNVLDVQQHYIIYAYQSKFNNIISFTFLQLMVNLLSSLCTEIDDNGHMFHCNIHIYFVYLWFILNLLLYFYQTIITVLYEWIRYQVMKITVI